MAIECIEAQEWIEEEFARPLEELVEKAEKKCKKRSKWNPLRWLCWLATTLVKVVIWVVVKVGKWVVRTACKLGSQLLAFLSDFFRGLWDILAGLFTLDWRRILDGLIRIGAAAVDFFLKGLRIVFLLDTLDYVITEFQRGQLRTYVRTKLGYKYSGQEFLDIVENLRIDHGAFGYRIPMRAVRTYLDSETSVSTDPGAPPNLWELNYRREINLRELCGFEFTEGFWNRKRYKTLKKGSFAGGGGGGEFDKPISASELETYLSSRGVDGPKFTVLCMRDRVLTAKLRAAEVAARGLGLMPQWRSELQEVTLAKHIVQDRYGTETGLPTGTDKSSLVKFLADKADRKRKVYDTSGMIVDESAALGDLCTPVVVGIFRYTDKARGLTACLKESPCEDLDAHDASGATFIDNQPDIVWKYIPIHELGHYFGLCHANGMDRIMYTAAAPIVVGGPTDWWSKLKGFLSRSFTWRTWYSLFLLKGEPSFTLDEAMQAWDYIIDYFPAACLGSKAEQPVLL